MGNLSKLIKDFISDPSKIEMLPELLTAAETLEKSELDAFALVEKTQATNRSLLQRVAAQPDTPPADEPKKMTAADISDSIVKEIYGGNE